MLTIGNRQIKRVQIVDDDPDAREAFGYLVEDMGLEAIHVAKLPGNSIQNLLDTLNSTDAILCDFQLRKRSYALFNGDQVIKQCFHRGIPGVLCTSYPEEPIRRDYLRYIPGFLSSEIPGPDSLEQAWTLSVQEMAGIRQPSRRPWRSLVRVDNVDLDRKYLYAVVPAWSVQTKVRIELDNLPTRIRKLAEPGRRFHALVNTGAFSPRDLFFDEWEER